MRDKAKQLITKQKNESKLEVMYLDNFVGLIVVDDLWKMEVGTVFVFFLFNIIKSRTVPAVPGGTFTALYSTIVGDRHD